MPIRVRPYFVHLLVAGLVMAGGVFDLTDALRTRHPLRLGPLSEFLPLEVHQGSRALLVLAGVVLIALGRGLARGKRRAWEIALVAVSGSLVLHLVRNFHLVFVLPPLFLLIYLILARRYFIAGSDPASTRQALKLAPALFAAIMAYGTLGQYSLRHTITPPFAAGRAIRVTLVEAVGGVPSDVTPLTRRARGFLGSIAWLSVGSGIVLVWMMLRPVILRRLNPGLLEARATIRLYGNQSLATFAAEDDKYHLLTAGGRAVVAYRVTTGVAVTVGDPIGPPETLAPSVDEFLAYCRRHDWTPCFYEVLPETLDIYRARGLRTLKVAEEAEIPLATFDLRGSKMQKLRQSLNKVEREHPGIRIDAYHGVPPTPVLDQLQMISDAWLSRKGIDELGFTMGRFDPAALESQRTVVASEDGRVVGFVTWRPFADGGWTIDLMRYPADAPKFIMDYLIVRSIQHLKEEGQRVVSLANAPLANVSPEDQLTLLDRGVRLVFENMHGIYEYKSLFQYKKKFNPVWRGRYLAFPSLDALPRIAVAILRVHRQRPLERQLLVGD